MITLSTERGHNEPPIVCLCGSTRFKEEYERVNAEFTLEGFIVLSCGLFAHADGVELPHQTKIELDVLHLRKIDMAGLVCVINPGGYIGESTMREIAYARSKGKSITYTERVEQ